MNEPTIHRLFDLTGRVALVTGATGWLGQSLSRALAEAGATVVAASRDPARAAGIAAALPSPGSAKHCSVTLDHLDESSLQHGFASAVAAAGQVDILVNNGNAAAAHDLTAVAAPEFNAVLANATGYFLLARCLRDHAVQRSAPGSVVMLGSMYGLVGSYPEAYEGICPASPVAYHALKGGILQMTRHLAVYWAQDGVRVNALSPGPFPGPRIAPEMVHRLCAKSPMGRMGQPHELKGALVFLASEASSYMTGQNLVIDGGWTAW